MKGNFDFVRRSASTELNTFLPDKVLVHIFGYLRIVNDIRSCRLVCRRWFLCCENRSITDNEKYVFRSGIYATNAINEILATHRCMSMHVAFVGIKLGKLDFPSFGHKLRSLKIEHTTLESSDIRHLARMFDYSPNLRHFSLYGMSNIVEFLGSLIFELLKNEVENDKLQTFEAYIEDGLSIDCISFDALYKIFPRLVSLRLPHIDLPKLVTKGDKVKWALKELSIASLHHAWMSNECTLLRRRSILTLLPKLSSLEISIEPPEQRGATFRFYLESLLQQTELSTLRIKIIQRRVVRHGVSNKLCLAKQLLLHILRNCAKLKTFDFYVTKTVNIHLDKNDTWEFAQAVRVCRSTLRDLTIPMITFDSGTLNFHLTSLEALQHIGLTLHLAMTDHRIQKLKIQKLYEDLSDILESRQNLRSLFVSVNKRSFDEISYTPNISADVRSIRNDSLETLHLSFYAWSTVAVQSVFTWNLPNLLALNLTGARGSARSTCVSAGFDYEIIRQSFVEWIQKTPRLIDVRLGWFNLSANECMEVCEHLSNLQTIQYRNMIRPTQIEIRNFFSKHATLRQVIVCTPKYERFAFFAKDDYNLTSYFIDRSKKLIYESDYLDVINYKSLSYIL